MSAGSGIRPLARELYRARIRVTWLISGSAIPVIGLDFHMDFTESSLVVGHES